MGRTARRLLSPLNRSKIQRSLSQLGPVTAKFVLIHSSLSHCGHILGGPALATHVLEDWLGNRTLVMPAHTYCYPDARGHVPVFDPGLTASVVGRISDHFWRQPGVMRSLHPTHSLAAKGRDAAWLLAGHEDCTTPCGAGTPYERLVHADTGVLMFGTTLDAYTLFHTSEDAARVPYLYEEEIYHLKIQQRNNVERDFPMYRQNMKITRRFTEITPWLQERGLLTRHRLGLGELLWLPSARAVHQALLEALAENPWLLTAKPPHRA